MNILSTLLNIPPGYTLTVYGVDDWKDVMKTYLKIKIKSLAEEAKIIRAEEKKWPGEHTVRYGLHEHRVHSVRPEARCSLLAYGFLRGREYRQMEAKCYIKPNWSVVERLIEKYGEGDVRTLKQKFAEWKDRI